MMSKFEELRDALAIDTDDFDSCIEQFPELFFHVCDGCELAVADRDQAKREYEDAQAEVEEKVREELADEKRLTEGAIKLKVQRSPRVKKLHEAWLKAKGRAGRWAALKQAWEQRSYMISHIADRQARQLASGNLGKARDRLGERNYGRNNELRSERGWEPER